MKKVLSVLSLIAILGMSSPAFAAPGGPGGHGGPGPEGPRGGHRIHAGAHHRPYMAPRHHHHGGVRIYTGHYPRHSHWYGYRSSYRWCPWCGYRLGHCPHYPSFGAYVPLGGGSFSIRF